MIGALSNLEDVRHELNKLQKQIDADHRWRWVKKESYVQTPLSTGTFRVKVPGDWEVGHPIKWSQAGTEYYGLVSSVTGDVAGIHGPAFSTADPIDGLWLGHRAPLQFFLYAPGSFANSTQNAAYWNVEKKFASWSGRRAYLVSAKARCKTKSGSPAVNVTLGGSRVFTSDLLVLDTLSQTGATIDPNHYLATHDVDIDYDVTVAGAGSSDLTIELLFIEE